MRLDLVGDELDQIDSIWGIELLKATSNLIRQWIKERGIISICDSILLGTNSIKLTSLVVPKRAVSV